MQQKEKKYILHSQSFNDPLFKEQWYIVSYLHVFHNYSGALAREAPWVRKFDKLCIQEILVLRKPSIRSTNVRTSTLHVSRGEILQVLLLSRVNRIATFTDLKNNNNEADYFFDLTVKST